MKKEDKINWHCAKCDGANVPHHFRTCEKREITKKENCAHYFPRKKDWSGSITNDWYFLPCVKCGMNEEYWYKIESRRHKNYDECGCSALSQCPEKIKNVVHEGGVANDEEVWNRVVDIVKILNVPKSGKIE